MPIHRIIRTSCARALLPAAFALAAGCGGGDAPLPPENTGLEYGGGSFAQQINVNGISRSYIVVVPESAAPGEPAPLLFVYHGHGQPPEDIREQSGLDSIAGAHGYLVVYPLGFDLRWKVLDNLEPVRLSDIDFTLEMVERIAEDIDIDRTRIYATGFSNGGQFTHRLGCELPRTLAAIAPVGSTFTIAVRDRCDQDDPIPVTVFLGDEDQQFPWEGEIVGSDGTLSAEDNLLYWADVNGCPAARDTMPLPDVDPGDQTTVSLYSYSGCAEDADTRMFRINGGGHTWPGSTRGGNAVAGRQTNDISASQEMIDFFDAHPLR